VSLAGAEAAEIAVEVATGEEGVSQWGEAWRRLRRNPIAIAGMILIAVFVLVAIFAPLLAPYAPGDVRPGRGKIRPGVVPGPSAQHWFGLDQSGRDELSRIIFGARYSLLIAVVSTSVGAAAGGFLGAVAGALGGWVDDLIMRVMDIMLSVPGLLFAIAVAAAIGGSLKAVMIAIAVTSVPTFARLLRGSMLSQRESDYVLAARSLGVRRWKIVTKHILPNSLAPVIVYGTLALATAIIEAAGLAFLGLSDPDPSIAEWGKMLAGTQDYLATSPHLALFPGIAIVLSVLGFNLLGDALREALDPKLRR
jgi:peptide/nickel transport system permease protein